MRQFGQALALLAAAACLADGAAAKTYNYTFTAVTPVNSPYYNEARDYGYVPAAAGTVLGKGTLTVSDTLNNLSGTFLCPNGGCNIYGNTVTGMTGTFRDEAITFLANPHAPEFFGAGRYYGDYQLLKDQPRLLDDAGIVFSTPSGGYSNLWGNPVVSGYPPYSVYDSNTVAAPTRSGIATEHFYGDFALTLAAETANPGGSEAAPTPLPLAAISAINGTIGPENLERFYSFDWAGGLFTSTAIVTQAQPTDNFKFLLRSYGAPNPNYAGSTVKFNADDNFTGQISTVLEPGRYTIGLLATLDVDPDFSILFGSPVGSSVPEPASWLTMIAGFGLVGAMRRRRRRSHAWAGI